MLLPRGADIQTFESMEIQPVGTASGAMESFFGKIIVASPSLDNTSFCRSVIFILQHNQDATVGLVLNRPADDQARRAWQGMVGEDVDVGMVSIGGPLAGPIVAIHSIPEAGEISLPGGLFSSATEDNLQYLASQRGIPLQVFFGLTGWQKGQLEDEIQQGHWLTTTLQEDLFFSAEEDLWRTAIKRMQNRFFHEVLGVKSLPANVLDN